MTNFNIMRSILVNGSEEVSKINLDNCTEKGDKFRPRIPDVTSALAASLTTLLCRRISPAAHQRYLVRTNLIEQLRDWSRINSRYEQMHSFTDGERTTKFAINLVEKYLTEDFIAKQASVSVLVKIGFVLIDMKLNIPIFDFKLDSIINRILYLDETDDSNRFLDTLTEKYDSLSLALSTIENIYVCRSTKLIEIPIVDLFMLFNANHSEGSLDSDIIEKHMNPSIKHCSDDVNCNQLLKYSSKSPRIFQLLSSVMKEMFAYTNCSEMCVNFIQYILNHISKLCDEKKQKILDLYPRNLQCVVILVRIEPNLHTNNSKEYVIQMLKRIYSLNKEELLILLSHFPVWLKEVSNLVPYSDNPLSR
ncbi:uncharacterized protein LOC107227546 isoform X1 [Neodiprion lecontei]|uniref:Uncharacterized protein LOC107227546 n=1 Tax=Neodiprion lecontei TaxID=441921 RepID=A0A6J0CDN8_NEOLC|nr:uncharacterized protein LOC107227546 isoform X1 [Neodiprion lecontei]XP_046587913.1 uncharacterized protein LOC107227546 isoform X1 [Neodiprion lecontei]XP_046587918.1 uncharacterized protein LOC107227546 isoform X1 [Neodiprion lecontei]